MQVGEFLKERTRFISVYYETAAGPFQEIKRKIEQHEEPFVPPYSEDGEPAFLEEWIDADTSLDVLGASCLAMLSEAIKLYFMTWEHELRHKAQRGYAEEFKKGFLCGYMTSFGDLLSIDPEICPADLQLIEQITLARNDASHPKDIATLYPRHNDGILEKHPVPFFLSENEKLALASSDPGDFSWVILSMKVSPEALLQAVAQIDALCDWLEEPMRAKKYGERRSSSNV